MTQKSVVLLNNPEGEKMVREVCKENGFHFSDFVELVEAEVEQVGRKRRAGLKDTFDDILDRIKIES